MDRIKIALFLIPAFAFSLAAQQVSVRKVPLQPTIGPKDSCQKMGLEKSDCPLVDAPLAAGGQEDVMSEEQRKMASIHAHVAVKREGWRKEALENKALEPKDLKRVRDLVWECQETQEGIQETGFRALMSRKSNDKLYSRPPLNKAPEALASLGADVAKDCSRLSALAANLLAARNIGIKKAASKTAEQVCSNLPGGCLSSSKSH